MTWPFGAAGRLTLSPAIPVGPILRPMTDARATPDELPEAASWPVFVGRLRGVAGVFGTPAEIAADEALTRADARLLAGWLRALEAIARALLMLRAAVLAPALGPGRMRQRRAGTDGGRGRASAVAAVLEADSRVWAGVAFRAFPPAPRPSPKVAQTVRTERGVGDPPPRFVDVRGLAVRFEALVRVSDAPDVYARRLALRLRASAVEGSAETAPIERVATAQLWDVDRGPAARLLRPPTDRAPACLPFAAAREAAAYVRERLIAGPVIDAPDTS